MKSTNGDNTAFSLRMKRNSIFLVVCSMAFSMFIVLPAFAQRDDGGRGGRQGSDRRSEVRSDRQAGRNDKATRPQANNSPQSNRPGPGMNAPQANRPNPGMNAPRPGGQGGYNGRYDHFYGRWPVRGATVRVLPAGGHWRVFGGVRYMYHDGFYYRPYGTSFVVAAPPLGFRIGTLPVGFVAFTLANAAYYYYAGAYYQRYNNEYVVVQPPLGALVQTIPDGGQQVMVDGNTYYIVDGVQYQAVMFNGSIWYKVIKLENQVDNYSGSAPY